VVLLPLEAGDVVLAHSVRHAVQAVGMSQRRRAVASGVVGLRIVEPAGAEAWRLQGRVVTSLLTRLSGTAGSCMWVVGECHGSW